MRLRVIATLLVAFALILLTSSPMYSQAGGQTVLSESPSPASTDEPSSTVSDLRSSDYTEMYGLSGKHILMKNQSRLHLVDVESNTVVNSTSCVGSPRISYDVRFVSCDSVAYKIGESDFVHAHGGHHQSADVETNLSISW